MKSYFDYSNNVWLVIQLWTLVISLFVVIQFIFNLRSIINRINLACVDWNRAHKRREAGSWMAAGENDERMNNNNNNNVTAAKCDGASGDVGTGVCCGNRGRLRHGARHHLPATIAVHYYKALRSGNIVFFAQSPQPLNNGHNILKRNQIIRPQNKIDTLHSKEQPHEDVSRTMLFLIQLIKWLFRNI